MTADNPYYLTHKAHSVGYHLEMILAGRHLNDAMGRYDAIVLAVAHQQFRDLGSEAIRGIGKSLYVLYDLKYVLPQHSVDLRL